MPPDESPKLWRFYSVTPGDVICVRTVSNCAMAAIPNCTETASYTVLSKPEFDKSYGNNLDYFKKVTKNFLACFTDKCNAPLQDQCEIS
jgi:hypothetical protein